MKININLQSLNNWGTGISLFGNELTNQLIYNSNYELYGCFNFVRAINKNDLKRFLFHIKYSKIPYKLVYSRQIKSRLPFSYNTMMCSYADVNLFFTYKIPRVKYKGITICTIHDLIPLKVLTEDKQIVNDYLNDITYSINNSDYLITVSEASKEDIIKEFNISDDKIFVIPNGVNFELFNNPIDDILLLKIREKYALPERFILYFGGTRKYKNVANLIKAYAILSSDLRDEISLVITQSNFELLNLVKELGLDSQVFFTTFIDEEDKPAIYKLAEVMVFISLYEGFGLPIIEAMASGTPVITSDVSSMPEVAGNAAVLVNPLEVKEISNALEKIIGDSEFRENNIKLGYENAKKYSWDHSGKKLMELLSRFNN